MPDAYRTLTRRDPVLARLVRAYGRPDPYGWDAGGRMGEGAFAELLLHIASQQISTPVAFALYDRVRAALGGRPGAAGVLALGRERLLDCGLSRAKASAMLALARMQREGEVDVDGLGALSDAAAVAALTAVPGIGRWTAEEFLLHRLRRPDVLPAGDAGIRRAVRRAWELPATPGPEEVRRRGEAWAPYRSYAAALLWTSLRAEAAG